jgi:hypothetical protein
MAPRDTFTGVGVGRKTGSEAGEAVVGVIFFLPSRWHLFDVGPTSRPLSAPINQLHPVIGTWGRESRLPLQLSRSPFGC